MEKEILVCVEFMIMALSTNSPHEPFYEWNIHNSLEYMADHKLDHLIKKVSISKFIIKYTLYNSPYSTLKKKGYACSFNHLDCNIQEYWAKKYLE
jgi:hypothetical protein